MAPPVPWGVPPTLRAGDTWRWQFSVADYPASESWVPSYALRGPDAPQWDPAWLGQDGETWTVTIPAAVTAALTAGRYRWAQLVAKNGESYTVCTGQTLVEENLTIAEGREDFDDALIAKLETAILQLSTGGVQSYTIGNRQVTYRDLDSLRGELGRAKARRYAKRTGRIDVPVLVRFQ